MPVSSGWLRSNRGVREVALGTNDTVHVPLRGASPQTTMTGTSFGQSSRVYCMLFETEHGAGSVSGFVSAGQIVPGTNDWCWYSIPRFLSLTNTGQPQVIRFGTFVPRGGGQIELVKTTPICDTCPPLPRYANVADFDKIRNEGISRVLTSIPFFILAALAALGVGLGHVLAIAYDLGRWMLPSERAARVKEALRTAKAEGSTFDTKSTHAYNKPAKTAFRRQQDLDDMADIAKTLRAEIERIRREEEALKRKKYADASELDRLTREYDRAVKRAKAAQARLERERNDR